MRKTILITVFILAAAVLLSACGRSDKAYLAPLAASSFSSPKRDFYCDGENMYCISGSYKTAYTVVNIAGKSTGGSLSDADCPEGFRLSSVRGGSDGLIAAAVSEDGETVFFISDKGEVSEICRVGFSAYEWTVVGDDLVIIDSAGSAERIYIYVADIADGIAECITPSAAVYTAQDDRIIYAECGEDVEIFEYDTKNSDGTANLLYTADIEDGDEIVALSADFLVLKNYDADGAVCIYEYYPENGTKKLAESAEGDAYGFCCGSEVIGWHVQDGGGSAVRMYLRGEEELKTVTLNDCQIISTAATEDGTLIVKGIKTVLGTFGVTVYYSVDRAGKTALIGMST